jgi:hypothetical protein
MEKTKNIKKIKKNVTRKKITIYKKKKFIEEILKEWKKQTGGSYNVDKISEYLNDYYLYFEKKSSFYNHIHLVLNDFTENHNLNNNILYVLKKYDLEKNEVVHSKRIKISIFSNPVIVVHNMIKRYVSFYLDSR